MSTVWRKWTKMLRVWMQLTSSHQQLYLLPSPFFLLVITPSPLPPFPLSPPILKLAIIVGAASVSAFRFLDLLTP